MNQKWKCYIKLIMGDWNGRIGEKQKEICWKSWKFPVGNHEYWMWNERRSRLSLQNVIVIERIPFSRKSHKESGHGEVQMKQQSNCIMIYRKHVIQDCSVLSSFNRGSDHRIWVYSCQISKILNYYLTIDMKCLSIISVHKLLFFFLNT